MPKINIQKTIYHLRWRYLTLNNVVLGIALIIGINWVWGSIGMMQRNYDLQKTLDLRHRQQQLVELETEMLAYEQKYYQSDEYKELAARQYLGLVEAGEKVLILPPTPPGQEDEPESAQPRVETPAPSNVKQWIDFLFGNNRRNLQK